MAANRKWAIPLLIFTILAAILYIKYFFATDHTVLRHIHELPQNTRTYIDPKQQIHLSIRDQEKLNTVFIRNYFSPWVNDLSSKSLFLIKNQQDTEYLAFKVKPGIGANTRPYTQNWLAAIEENMNLYRYPTDNQLAITVRDSNIRILPTKDPSFSDTASVSKGYPFDNLQRTFIPLGTPVRVIHVSKQKDWDFVVASGYSGWIPDEDIALVSQQFIKKWQTGNYAISTQDNIPIFDKKKKLLTKTRIGVLYPVLQATKSAFIILVPGETVAGNAVIQTVEVNKSFLTQFPIPISTQNIADIANSLIGQPYGWGGIYGYRDCSATTKDLMAGFGIWLPRHSLAQKQVGQYIPLASMSNKNKEKMIIKKGIPFLTLINLPGHVALYIGEKNGHPIILQNMWGLHIYKLFNKDRIVIGQTVITPLDFGHKFINSSLNYLSAVDSMTLLVDPLTLK